MLEIIQVPQLFCRALAFQKPTCKTQLPGAFLKDVKKKGSPLTLRLYPTGYAWSRISITGGAALYYYSSSYKSSTTKIKLACLPCPFLSALYLSLHCKHLTQRSTTHFEHLHLLLLYNSTVRSSMTFQPNSPPSYNTDKGLIQTPFLPPGPRSCRHSSMSAN